VSYIITTHRHLDDPTTEFLPGAAPAITRQTVVTLEEARTHLLDRFGSVWISGVYEPLAREVMALTESGSTVGPLPDGTVIVVEPEGKR
jgi:hypothetical protein